MAVKDWSTFDLTQDRGDTRFPPPEYECHRTPTLNANTVLKAISDHSSDRLEYLWLDTRQGRHQIPPPPGVRVSQDTHPQCQYRAKSHFRPWQWQIGVHLTWHKTGETPDSPPPGVRVSQDTHPQCQYRAKSHFRPWQWKIGVPLTWHKTVETPDSPPRSTSVTGHPPSMPIPC